MSAKEQRKQQVIFLLFILIIIGVAIGSGLYFNQLRIGDFGIEGEGGGAAGERYATLTDAQVMCEVRAREVFGLRVHALTVDAYSSRLDKKAGLFRVFMEADLYPSEERQGPTVRHYINCTTRTDRLAIASFQFAKDGESMKEQGRSIFGF